MALIGTVFFAELNTASFTDAFTTVLPIVGGLFLVAAAFPLVLPRTGVSEEEAEAAA